MTVFGIFVVDDPFRTHLPAVVCFKIIEIERQVQATA